MGEAGYYTPTGGLPPQTQLLSDRNKVAGADDVVGAG